MDVFKKKKRSWLMSRVKTHATKPELVVGKVVKELGYKIKTNVKSLPGTPDIVIPGKKAVIIVNGCFWHGHSCKRAHLPATNKTFWTKKIEGNVIRDKKNLKLLKKLGWKYIIVWQCHIKDEKKVIKRIEDFIKKGN